MQISLLSDSIHTTLLFQIEIILNSIIYFNFAKEIRLI